MKVKEYRIDIRLIYVIEIYIKLNLKLYSNIKLIIDIYIYIIYIDLIIRLILKKERNRS